MPRAWRERLIAEMLGADLIGFHTNDYASYFLDTIRRTLWFEQANGFVNTGSRLVKVGNFPLGIDARSFSERARSEEVAKRVHELEPVLGTSRLVFSVDRLDFTR